MPQRIPLILNPLLEALLHIEHSLIIAINILDTLPQLYQVVEHMLRLLQLMNHLPILTPLLLELFQLVIDFQNILLGCCYFGIHFIECFLDFGPIRVALLLMTLHKFIYIRFQPSHLSLNYHLDMLHIQL